MRADGNSFMESIERKFTPLQFAEVERDEQIER